ERSEVRDLIAALRLLGDLGDRVALARLLARPPLQQDPALGLGRTAGAADPLEELAGWTPTEAWATALLGVRALVPLSGVDEVFYELMEKTSLLDVLLAGAPGGERARIQANVARFAELVDEFCVARPDQSLGAFLEHLELVLLSGVSEEVAETEVAAEAVQVMTIHQAKGLEFDPRLGPALVEGRLPQAGWRDGFE